ncbi:hypothetical protein HOP50_15g75050 [Chloropicon primus]|uniref:LamG-like jellyroll fold domain-containing protein n=1 Tax=Chloropicon primus TaxID=1764295 RepID=A0A5B8MZA8_9CHLO|nr:hypothetical protein A3770_15p74800 [Chloropicon primus]UPR04171.1 hypothetical protein HOP50_15g75050 [Chloropicon primus]|eukprot:QDZ24962.1 hypothetical protein A3770_15p74800 [Chloropicon primus]
MLLRRSLVVLLVALAGVVVSGSEQNHVADGGVSLLSPQRSLHFDGEKASRTYFGSGALEAPEDLNAATVSAWVKVDRHKRYNWVAGTANRENGWALFLDEGEKACFGLFTGGQLRTISNRSLQLPKAWHYVSGVFSNGTIQVFVDAQPGEVVPLSHRSLSTGTWGEGVLVGGSPDFPQLRMHGQIAGVHLWSSARTASQLARDMVTFSSASPAPQPCEAEESKRNEGLVASWAISQSTGETRDSEGRLVVEEATSGRNLVTKGSGSEPRWRISNPPVYVHAVARASRDGDRAYEARLGSREPKQPGQRTSDVSYMLDRMPLNLELEAFLESTSNETLGQVPHLPWPLVPKRWIRISTTGGHDGAEESRHLCGRLSLRMLDRGKGSLPLPSQIIYLVTHPRENLSPDYSEIVDHCHFADDGVSTVRRIEESKADISLLFFTQGEGLDASKVRIAEFGNALLLGSFSLQCFLFNVVSKPHRLETARFDINKDHTCLVYTVSSAHVGLRIAQSISDSRRSLIATANDVGLLPPSFPRILQAAVSEDEAAKLYSLVPDQGHGLASSCPFVNVSRGNDTEAETGAAVMEQRRFAETIVSSLGGSEVWWPMFVPHAITLLETDLLRSVNMQKAHPSTLSFSTPHSAYMETVIGLWQVFVQLLMNHGSWDAYQNNSAGGSHGLRHNLRTYSRTKGLGAWEESCKVLSEIILALQSPVL